MLLLLYKSKNERYTHTEGLNSTLAGFVCPIITKSKEGLIHGPYNKL